MGAYRPLSKRGKPDARLDEPFEGLPDHLWDPVYRWFYNLLWEGGGYGARPSHSFLESLQLILGLDPPLDWRSAGAASTDLYERMAQDREFALDVLDFALHHFGLLGGFPNPASQARALNLYLRIGGSVWEATPTEDERRWQLTRRAIGPVRDAIADIKPASERAHSHLTTAWNRLEGRNPDPSGAYREAIRAIECVAKPVITPNDSLATLGKMIGAMRSNPKKWTFVLGTDAGPVADMAALVWKSQLDRHGTDDESVPLNVSQEEADAAVHVSIALVRIFAGRLIDTP